MRAVSEDPSFDRMIAESAVDLHTVSTADGTYLFASRASLALFGWDREDLVGEHQDGFTHPDDVALVQAARREALAGPASTVHRFRCADGSYRWTETVSSAVSDGDDLLVLSAVRDIGDRKASDLDLHRRATTDPLTGIANRTVFMDRLHQALRRLARRQGLVAVLFLDLDHFKLINDTVGHLAGDAVLLQLAQRLRGFLRPQDTLARLGGDEFAIVIEDISWAEEAAALGARIVEAGRLPFVVGEEQFTCTTSIGIAVTTDAHHGTERLLQEADLAMYRAKDRGRDRTEVFDEDLRTRAVGRLGTERMLRRATEEGRLQVAYQPIIDLRTGATIAAEALVRVWDPEELRLIAAGEFIEVAEESGMLAAMDDWVLGQATRQAARWRELFAGSGFTDIAINVTARHLADPRFAQSIIDGLVGHDLPAGTLQVEVTERVLMEASNSAMTGLKLLRDAGVKVGLDDFGTGYSSLSYLRMFPLDFVKIDGSFIQELGAAGTERAIVSSVVDLSHALGMAVVAEGVETLSQLEQLVGLGCDRAQGFWFAPPGTAQALEDRVLRSDTRPGDAVADEQRGVGGEQPEPE